MGLETGTYISSLNSSNPVTGDNKTEGDDHLRLIKATILATFPNVTGAMTATHTELSRLAGGAGGKSFSAYRSTNQTTGNTVLFNSENYDLGNGYDPTTGIFAAPVTGYYIFTASVTIVNSTGATHYPYISIIHNNTTPFGYSSATAVTGGSGAICVSAIKLLTATDTVKINASNEVSGSLAADFYVVGQTGSVFTGHLLA